MRPIRPAYGIGVKCFPPVNISRMGSVSTCLQHVPHGIARHGDRDQNISGD